MMRNIVKYKKIEISTIKTISKQIVNIRKASIKKASPKIVKTKVLKARSLLRFDKKLLTKILRITLNFLTNVHFINFRYVA